MSNFNQCHVVVIDFSDFFLLLKQVSFFEEEFHKITGVYWIVSKKQF